MPFKQRWDFQLRSKFAAAQDEEERRWQLLFSQVSAVVACVSGSFIVNSQDALPSASFLMQGTSQRAGKGKVRVDEVRFGKRTNSRTGD